MACEVELRVNHSGTAWGENVAVLGEHSALGAWQTPIVLNAESFPEWRTIVRLPAGEQFAYKYVVCKDGAVCAWEPIEGNRKFATAEAGKRVVVCDQAFGEVGRVVVAEPVKIPDLAPPPPPNAAPAPPPPSAQLAPTSTSPAAAESKPAPATGPSPSQPAPAKDPLPSTVAAATPSATATANAVPPKCVAQKPSKVLPPATNGDAKLVGVVGNVKKEQTASGGKENQQVPLVNVAKSPKGKKKSPKKSKK